MFNDMIKCMYDFYCSKYPQGNPSKFADMMSVNKGSVIEWVKVDSTIKIRKSKFKQVATKFEEWCTNHGHHDSFDYICEQLHKLGHQNLKLVSFPESCPNLFSRLDYIARNYNIPTDECDDNTVSLPLDRVDLELLIKYIKKKVKEDYSSFIKVTEARLNKAYDFSFIKTTPTNHLILKIFDYKFIIVATNYRLEANARLQEYIKKLKESHQIRMIIVFSDIDIEIDDNRFLLNTYNLFWNTVSTSDYRLQRTVDIDISYISETEGIERQIRTIRYAKAVIHRLLPFINVIKDELVYMNANPQYEGLVPRGGSREKSERLTQRNLFNNFLQCTYVMRQAAYHEEQILNLNCNGDLRYGLVLEIGCTNIFLSDFYKKCEKIIHLTASEQKFHFMEEYKKFFHPCVEFRRMHINPDYLTSIYSEEICNKVDLVILGVGYASRYNNITDLMRHVANWLKPTGSLLISFLNSNSVMREKYIYNHCHSVLRHNPMYVLESSSEYKESNYPSYLRLYNVDDTIYEVSRRFKNIKAYTYPLISGLVNSKSPLILNYKALDSLNALCYDSASNPQKVSIAEVGHYITVLCQGIPQKETSQKLHESLIRYLKNKRISYDLITHPFATSSKELERAIKGHLDTDVEVLKTTILVNRNLKKKYYIITPTKIQIADVSDFKFLREREVVSFFGVGCISPFSYLLTKNNAEMDGEYICSIVDDHKKYVVFSSGMNNSSIKILKEDFIKIIESDGVKLVRFGQLIDGATFF